MQCPCLLHAVHSDIIYGLYEMMLIAVRCPVRRLSVASPHPPPRQTTAIQTDGQVDSRYLNTGRVALTSPPGVGVMPCSRSSIFPSVPGVTGTESVPAVLARLPSLDSFEGGRVGGST
jgi:hypothetical protein